MNKVLFLTDLEKQQINNEINNELKIKNRLIKVLKDNEHHKLSAYERSKLENKYKDQIMMLETIQTTIRSVKCRSDIQRLNSMIDYYNSLSD